MLCEHVVRQTDLWQCISSPAYQVCIARGGGSFYLLQVQMAKPKKIQMHSECLSKLSCPELNFAE